MAELTQFKDWPWQHWANLRPNSIALVTESQSMTWESVSQQITDLRTYFLMQGVEQRQCIVLHGKNSVELLLESAGTYCLWGSCLPLNPRLPEPVVRRIITSS
ncbi:hypothetical protein AAY77_02385 [Providencia rettgeri]|nr:hypothetical protein AAY77_02385 [Providencia rettgeri]